MPATPPPPPTCRNALLVLVKSLTVTHSAFFFFFCIGAVAFHSNGCFDPSRPRLLRPRGCYIVHPHPCDVDISFISLSRFAGLCDSCTWPHLIPLSK
jgi:hypothetical protein